MDNLSLNEANDKIIEAIANQRWFFFENKPKVLMDKWTGILWANLNYFPYTEGYNKRTANKLLKNFYIIDGFKNWCIPTKDEIKFIVKDKSFPFCKGPKFYIEKECHWIISNSDFQHYNVIDLFDFQIFEDLKGNLLPCNYTLIKDYANKINDSSYNKIEKAQFTLDLFVKNNLIPIFTDKRITELYKKIYIEKSFVPSKVVKQSVQITTPTKINKIIKQPVQIETPIIFDSETLLSKYTSKNVDKSIIKYYQTIQQWINELMNNVDVVEKQKKNILSSFNTVGLKWSKNFINDPNLTTKENNLLKKRQQFLQNNLSLGTNIVKQQLLSVRQQADEIEEKLNDINNGLISFKEMAKLEKEERPSFSFIAENTINIIKHAIKKIEYFEINRRFVTATINIWEQWTEDYKVFKTKDKEELKNNAEYDGIDESIWQGWYTDWQKLRFTIEEKIQPALARGLKGDIPTEKENEITVIEQLIRCLEMYKEDIDKFYLEERKGIYQKYAFAPGGDLQDKFETESELYKRTAKFQSDLQEIIFSCSKTADRMFILKWAENLLDIQIDEIISFVADKDLQQISREVLQSFSALKQKNYDAYLNDAKAYSQEKANREKQYNSLMFKMRNELNKQK